MTKQAPSAPARWKRCFQLRGQIKHSTVLGLGVFSFVLILIAWNVATAVEILPPQYLPSPMAILRALYSLFVNFDFANDIYISVVRVAVAFALAAVMAVPLGILMSLYKVIGAMSEPVVDLVRYLPVPALVPLTVIWLGVGEESKVALLWMGTFFQLILLIADDTKRVPQEFIETAYTVGAKQRHVICHVVFPSILPNMVDNLRITLGWCWSYVILAEIVAANEGIGHIIWASRRFGKTPEVMAGVFTIGFIGLMSDQLIRLFHRRAFRYLS